MYYPAQRRRKLGNQIVHVVDDTSLHEASFLLNHKTNQIFIAEAKEILNKAKTNKRRY